MWCSRARGITEKWSSLMGESGRGRSLFSHLSSAVDSLLLRSLKAHYLDLSKMPPPPKISPPEPFSVIKCALDRDRFGPVLQRKYREEEEIKITVMRLANLVPEELYSQEEDLEEGDDVNQLFLHVDVVKPNQHEMLQFLCGLYPDAIGIQAVSVTQIDAAPPTGVLSATSSYSGPNFQELDEHLRDAFHNYIEERGINEKLFPFLQAWVYIKEHRKLMRWFKTVGTFINHKDNL